jgi:DNA adenine methylase
MVESPLKYKGDDLRIVSLMTNVIPKNAKKICSPFLGGGSLELTLANRGKKIFAYTDDLELLEFWQCLSEEPKRVADLASAMRSDFYQVLFKDPVLYNALRDARKDPEDRCLRAALFFALNMTNDSRSVATGKRAPNYKRKFNELVIVKLRGVPTKNIKFLQNDSFSDIARLHKEHLLYCRVPNIIPYTFLDDPEYDEEIGWEELNSVLQGRGNWILYCNNHARIRKAFSNDSLHFVNEEYKLTDDEKAKEVIIVRRS